MFDFIRFLIKEAGKSWKEIWTMYMVAGKVVAVVFLVWLIGCMIFL